MKFGELLKSKEAEGKEKHVPAIEVGKGFPRKEDFQALGNSASIIAEKHKERGFV